MRRKTSKQLGFFAAREIVNCMKEKNIPDENQAARGQVPCRAAAEPSLTVSREFNPRRRRRRQVSIVNRLSLIRSRVYIFSTEH